MIPVAQLRAGNYIKGNTGTETVRMIMGHEGYKNREDVHEIYKHLIGVEENRNQYNLAEVFPIPLTEEWLLKLGAKKNEHLILPSYEFDISWHAECYKKLNVTIQPGNQYGYLREQNDDYPAVREKDYLVTIFNGDRHGILSVHFLQNIYFLVTGKELTIKQ